MLAIAVWPRGADPDSLRNVINAQEYEIESPCPDPAQFQITHERLAEVFDHAVQVFRIEERLEEF